MRVAIVHDNLLSRGGAERVAAVLCDAFPGAPLYTSIYLPDRTYPDFSHVDVRPIPALAQVRSELAFKALFPLSMLAWSRLRLTGYDVVLSSSTQFGKFVTVAGGIHVCYCYTPFRLAWRSHSYLLPQHGRLRRLAIDALGAALRPLDRRAAGRVDRFLTMTETTRSRIKEAYGRESTVIPPPIDCGLYEPAPTRDDYYLLVSRLEPYKRVDIVIEAFNQLGLRLRVVGDGTQANRLRALAGPNLEFVRGASDDDLRTWYARARAVVVPQEEDYGLVPLESLASGTPVIAFGAGGVLDTMIPARSPEEAPHATALFFDEQSPAAVAATVRKMEDYSFDRVFLRRHAQRFDKPAFIARVREVVRQAFEDGPRVRRPVAG